MSAGMRPDVSDIAATRTREEAALDIARNVLRQIGYRQIDATLYAIHARAGLERIAVLLGETQ